MYIHLFLFRYLKRIKKLKLGGFTCSCKEGWQGNGFVCEDVDECSDDPQICSRQHEGSICINNEGSFDCGCPAGYNKKVLFTGNRFQKCIHLNTNKVLRKTLQIFL